MPDESTAVEVFAGLDTLSLGAAERIALAARAAIVRRKRFTISLAGGHTPRALYELLARDYRQQIQWRQVHVFFGDERCVPSHNPESNYAMAAAALLSRVPLLKRNVHRIAGEPAAADAARMYERALRREFPEDDAPSFDVLLLGVGADGHTASLFPGSRALDERDRWVIPVDAPAGITPPHRITLTLPILNRAREVFFLVAGADKRPAISAILTGGSPLPAAQVRGVERTLWLLDRAAAPEVL
jgi:6-phosphogluconolactonase